MKYAHIDNKNKLLGWYDLDVHTNIPTPNIEVTDEQWQVAIDNGHNKVNTDGITEQFDFRTAEEIAEADRLQQLSEAKQYLADTMWINDKYTDVVLINKLMTDEEYKDKYSLEYQKRAEARALINSLEG